MFFGSFFDEITALASIYKIRERGHRIIGVVSTHQKFRIHQVKMFQKDKQKNPHYLTIAGICNKLLVFTFLLERLPLRKLQLRELLELLVLLRELLSLNDECEWPSSWS